MLNCVEIVVMSVCDNSPVPNCEEITTLQSFPVSGSLTTASCDASLDVRDSVFLRRDIPLCSAEEENGMGKGLKGVCDSVHHRSRSRVFVLKRRFQTAMDGLSRD